MSLCGQHLLNQTYICFTLLMKVVRKLLHMNAICKRKYLGPTHKIAPGTEVLHLNIGG